MEYRVLHKKDFLSYGVKEIHPSIRLMIAFCLRSGQDLYVANIMETTRDEGQLLHYVRKAKEMNREFQNKQRERNSYLYGTSTSGSTSNRE